MTLVTLVSGGDAAQRETAIAARLDQANRNAVLLEGLPSGNATLDGLVPAPLLARIAPACMHCTGNLVMRVTLHRLLRQQPQHLFIAVATDEHIAQLRQFLSVPPYDALLSLAPPLVCGSAA